MERELTDEEQQILKALRDLIGSSYGYGRGLIDRVQDDETSDSAFDALWQAITTLRHQARNEGIAWGLILAERHDLITYLPPDVEQAAAVIMAERFRRKDNNDS